MADNFDRLNAFLAAEEAEHFNNLAWSAGYHIAAAILFLLTMIYIAIYVKNVQKYVLFVLLSLVVFLLIQAHLLFTEFTLVPGAIQLIFIVVFAISLYKLFKIYKSNKQNKHNEH